MCRFLKIIPSKESRLLAKNYPNAFILLFFIADRARRENGDPDGLTIGQCHIGDWENMGLTRQEYRSALKHLVLKKYIEIIETCRTRSVSEFRKRATTDSTTDSTTEVTTVSTTVGTLIKLCDTRIYDINSEIVQPPIQPPIQPPMQPKNNHEQERERKRKKKKEELPHTPLSTPVQKIKFRDLVELTQAEYDSLLAKNGIEFLNLLLDKLDSSKGSKGYTYKSDFHTMKEGGWVVNQVRKDLQEQKRNDEKHGKNGPGRLAQGNNESEDKKFQPGRILRGSNNEGSLLERGRND